MITKSVKFIVPLAALKERLQKSRQAFKEGRIILIGDDGRRENEVDLVFHASAATPENVNFLITYGKGVLCVSLSHELADQYGFYTAPKFPGSMKHTNFTLPVDAKNGISTGISAKDRSHTISLMAKPEITTMHDFITPGHVYPLRAMEGGLLTRSGHTEALYELCRMEQLPCAAALCEVLGEDGNTLDPHFILKNLPENSVFKDIPFISTIDILWGKILFEKSTEVHFATDPEFLYAKNKNRLPISTYILQAGFEEKITLPTVVSFYTNDFSPENLRISITNSISSWDNGVSQDKCCAEISLFSLGNCLEDLPQQIEEFCDLSAKEGLKKTKNSVRRMLSTLRSAQFIYQHFKPDLSWQEYIQKINFVVTCDKELIVHLSE